MNNTTKKIIIIILFFIVILIGIGFWIFNGGKSESEPVLQTGIVVTSPKANEEVSSPLKITGYVNGDGWSGFEGQVGLVKLLDNENRELAQSILTATSDWMTSLIYLEANLEFLTTNDENGTLLFLNENPSDLPEKDKELRLPVKIIGFKGETMKVKVYYNNSEMDPEFSCNKVFAIEREVTKTEAVARAALEELLKGPTNQEKSQGFLTSINSGVKIQKLVIEDGTAKVDFDEQLEYQVGGSCRVAAIRAEITQTLKQFPTIKDIIISINGRTEDILQP